MAFGAERVTILRSLLGHGMRMACGGIVIGVAAGGDEVHHSVIDQTEVVTDVDTLREGSDLLLANIECSARNESFIRHPCKLLWR
jgi:hypothetical protein